MAVAKVRHVRVADEVWARWREAAADRRVSVAGLVHAAVDLLLVTEERELVGRAVARVGGRVEVVEPAAFDVEVVDSAPKPSLRRRTTRTEMCEHRVPATSHCSRCDS